jgi:hypothetical protein
MTRQASPSPPRENSDASLPDTVKNEATEIATSTAEQAGQVTNVMSQQAKAVLSETGHQARHLLEQGVDELRGQAREGQQKVADGLRGLADQLHTMSERSETGMASDVVRQVSQRARSAADWLESREPGDLLNELRDFARRRPGVFLAGAAFTGALVGRLTRNMVTATKNDEPDHGQHRLGSGEFPNPADGITTPGLPSATDPGYASASGYAPPAPAELDNAMTGTSGHPDTGSARS